MLTKTDFRGFTNVIITEFGLFLTTNVSILKKERLTKDNDMKKYLSSYYPLYITDFENLIWKE